jgi:drug/metabolite transporter (DMT)-like permease
MWCGRSLAPVTAVDAPQAVLPHLSATDWARWAVPGLVWGTSFYFIAEGLTAFPAALITPMRLGIGFLTLGMFSSTRRTTIEPADRWRVALLGVIWMAIPLSLFPFAEERVSSSVTGMLNGAMPIFVTAVAAMLAHRLPAARRVLGLAVGFAGVVLIAIPAGGSGSSSWIGIAMIFVALVFYGFALNLAAPLQQKYGSPALMWRAQGVALALTLPIGLTQVGSIRFTWSALFAMLALGMFGTALAYVAMANNVGRLGSSRASASIYLIPVVSLFLGAVVRHEQVAMLSVLGCVVALAGAYLATSSARS